MRVGIAGFGTIGKAVAKILDEGIPGFELVGVAARDKIKAQLNMAAFKKLLPVLTLEELAIQCDVIVECLPTEKFMALAIPALNNGCDLVTVSAAAIMQQPGVVDIAKANKVRIILATGALLGLDAVRAAAEGTIHSVKMVTRKPPSSLRKARFVIENHIQIDDIEHPLKLFEGSAREGAEKFPANVNVAASLGLAGLGPDTTHLEIWADPTKKLNTHTITVDSDSARFEMTIENIPTEENPGTGKITALSVIAALRSLNVPLRVGT